MIANIMESGGNYLFKEKLGFSSFLLVQGLNYEN